MMFSLGSHVRRELFSIYHYRYSTATKSSLIDESSSAVRTQFVNYLVNTFGFSQESAVSLIIKGTPFELHSKL
ncbi:hypothetical protein R6Q59_019491 [Mikania micrantha]